MPENTANLQFAGFRRQPDGHYPFTMVPNQFLDEIVPHEKPCVVKVVCLILRRTIGWVDQQGQRRTSQQVAYTEFAREMHMSTQAVADGLKIALAKGYIVRVKEGSIARNGQAEGAWYGLRWDEAVAEKNQGSEIGDQPEVDSDIQSSEATLKSRDIRNKADSDQIKNQIELNLSSISARPLTRAKGTFSTYIGNVISSIGEQFGDTVHRLSNIKHALNLWDKPTLSEKEYVGLLYQARDLTRAHSSSLPTTADVSRNRMPYFFRVLENLVKQVLPLPTPALLPQVEIIPLVETPRATDTTLPANDQFTPEPTPVTPSVDLVLRRDLAERWSVEARTVLQSWQHLLGCLTDGRLREVLTRSLGIKTSQATASLCAAVGAPTKDGIILLFNNPFEARYAQHHSQELIGAVQQVWGSGLTLHSVCL